MTIHNAIAEHVEARIARGRTAAYVEIYLRELAGFLGRRGVKRIEDVGAGDVEEYAAMIAKRKAKTGIRGGEVLAVSTRANMIAVVRVFFREMERAGRIMWNPCARIIGPKTVRTLPWTDVDAGDIARMIETCDGSPLGVRDRAVLELLYGSGLRRAEVAGLDLYDVDVRVRTARVRGKGGKERVVPVTHGAAAVVARYLDEVRPTAWTAEARDALFVTASGRMSAATVNVIVRRAAVRAGVTVRVYPHALRHACATEMIRGGADVRAVQELLGHEKAETTQIYTHVAPVDLIDAHRRFHPRGWATIAGRVAV